MAENVFEHDVLLNLRLPWKTICHLAVAERCTGQPANSIIEQALTEHLAATHQAESAQPGDEGEKNATN